MAQPQTLSDADTTSSGPLCRIDLLGGLQLWNGTRSTGRFRTQKAAALFAYLVFHADRMHARDALRELLWPDAAPQAGSMNLSVALSSLRSLVESLGVSEEMLQADRHKVGINSHFMVTDVARFEELLNTAEKLPEAERIPLLRSAVSLYRGPLLPNLYEDWISTQQVRLSDRFFEANRLLAQAYRQANDVDSSLQCLRRVVECDPVHVEAARCLMRAQLEAGQQAEAARTFHELQQALGDKKLVDMTGKELRENAEALLGELYQQIEPHLNSYQRRVATGAGLRKRARKPGKTDERLLTSPCSESSDDLLQSGVLTMSSGSVPRDMPAAVPVTPGLPPGLPLPITRFFGRDEEMMRLGWLLGDPSARLVTLTGPAGSGKTRLALSVAEERRRRRDAQNRENGSGFWNLEASPFPELCDSPDLSHSLETESETDVVFLSFTDSDTEVRLPELLADALGVRLPVREDADLAPTAAWTQDALDMLSVALAGRPGLLLILDNFETLAATSAAPFLERLLLQTTPLKVLATSRCRLPITGEREFSVPPLPTPPLLASHNLDRYEIDGFVAQWPSLALFVDRARTAFPEFQVNRHNLAAVTELVNRLDGLPLAIELAAARCQVFSPAELLKRMDNRFDLLVTSRYGTPDRRHSLRESLLFSYRLLTPALQNLFCRLSVFRGGFTLDAAFAISDDPLTHDHLARLADASLVQVRSTEDGALRFDQLETLRAFAAEQLAQISQTEQDSLRARHARYWVQLAENAKPHLSGPDQNLWLTRLDTDLSNLRATLTFCLSEPVTGPADSRDLALRFGAALPPYWHRRGMHTEGASALRSILALWSESLDSIGLPPCDPEVQRKLAHLWNGIGVLQMSRSEWAAARAAYNRGLLLWQEIGDARGLAATRNNRAMLEQQTGDLETAQAEYEASLAWWRNAGDDANVARVLNNLSVLATWQGQFKVAQLSLTESLGLTRQNGDVFGFALRLHNLGELALECSKPQRAETYYASSLEHAHAGRNWSLCALSLLGQSVARLQVHRNDSYTLQHLEAALDYLDATQTPIGVPIRNHLTRLNLAHYLRRSGAAGKATENVFEDGFPDVGDLTGMADTVPVTVAVNAINQEITTAEALTRLQRFTIAALPPSATSPTPSSVPARRL